MPLVENNQTTYYTIDTTEIAFKTKVDGEEVMAPKYTGYLSDVVYKEGEYQGRPANKYHFIFVDDEGNREILQSGEESVFSTSLINTLLSVDGEYGKYTIGVFQPDGKEFIANWVYQGDDRIEWKYSAEQLTAMADRSFSGDKTALTKKLFEDELKPKIEKQGTTAQAITSSSDTIKTAKEAFDAVPAEATKAQSANATLETVDDDLPF